MEIQSPVAVSRQPGKSLPHFAALPAVLLSNENSIPLEIA